MPYPPSARLTPKRPELVGKLGWFPCEHWSFCITIIARAIVVHFGAWSLLKYLQNQIPKFLFLFHPALSPPFPPAFNLCGVSIIQQNYITCLPCTLLSIGDTEKSKTRNSACLLELYSSQGWQSMNKQIHAGEDLRWWGLLKKGGSREGAREYMGGVK